MHELKGPNAKFITLSSYQDLYPGIKLSHATQDIQNDHVCPADNHEQNLQHPSGYRFVHTIWVHKHLMGAYTMQ